MSFVSIYSNNVKRKKDEISRLKNERVRFLNTVSDCSKKILRASQQINSTKSQSVIKSKLNEMSREEKKKSDAEKRVNDYDKKITTKEKELYREEQKLYNEQAKESKTIEIHRNTELNSIHNSLRSQHLEHMELSNEVKRLKESKEKINILFLASNPDIYLNDKAGDAYQQEKLKLDKEAREIHDAIQKSLKRDSINFQTRWAIRVADLFQYINEVNPTIIHFSGHGTENGDLVFQDNNDNPKLVSIENIVEMINASSDDVRLVTFNNCFSSSLAEAVVENVEAAIGMNSSIGDKAAIIFSSQLYSSIGFGLSLEKAFQQAIVSLKLTEIPEDNTPQLFVNQNFKANEIFIVKRENN